MDSFELLALLVTGIGVVSFAIVFTVLYLSHANSAIEELKSGKADLDLIDDTIYANMNGKKVSRRVWQITKQVLSYVAIALLIPILALSIYTKATSGVAMLGGKGVIVVASGSMSQKNAANPYLATLHDQFDTYDMIMLRRVDSQSELKQYDIIAYRNPEGVNVIHRITGFTSDGRYIMRGDSNNADDDYHPTFEDVVGKYTHQRIPLVGIFVVFLQSYSGALTLLAIIYCLIMISVIGNKIYNAQTARLEILKQAIDFENDEEFDDDLDYRFLETIIYKNQEYVIVNKPDDTSEEAPKGPEQGSAHEDPGSDDV